MRNAFRKGEAVWAPHSDETPNILHHGSILQIKGPKALVRFEAWKSFPELEPERVCKIQIRFLQKYSKEGR